MRNATAPKTRSGRPNRKGPAVAAEKAAIAAEKAAAEDRNRAVSESQRADVAAKSSSSINEFLEQDLLAQADPNVQVDKNTQRDPDLKVRTALDRAAKRIQGRFEGQPLIEAGIRQTIGKSYDDLGLYAEAQRRSSEPWNCDARCWENTRKRRWPVGTRWP